MPELRKDPILGRWVIIAVERARRPKAFKVVELIPEKGDCPFCEGKEAHTQPEIFAIRKDGTAANQPGWLVRVIPSKTPFLKIEGDLNRHGKGVYDVMGGVGAHEIIVDTPEHIANIADLDEIQIAKVIACCTERFGDLSRDIRFKYLLLFKNYESSSEDGHVRHSRTQLIATPVTPKRVKEELAGAKRYYDYHERCIFCDLIRQEIQSGKRVVVETDSFVAITPFACRFPFEVWILPKKHACDFTGSSVESRLHLAQILKKVLTKIKVGLNDPVYSLVMHTSPLRRKNSRASYWKTVEQDYHWHIEILPKITSPAGFEWGTGFYICPISPEESAKYLREVIV